MQKKNKKQTKPTKQIIIYTIIIILLLLLVFAEDIIKLANKNRIGLLENTPNETMPAEPNVPVISAGMIPVKWDETNWIITTREDEDWYDYKSGKLAYVMLNDGYYRSEIERGVEQDQLMENNILEPIDSSKDLGTIFAWIPRFAYNEDGEIQYIKDVESADENWTIPDMFTHTQPVETAPDFLLTGVWLEKDVDNQYLNKITKMNQEDSIYGFIKNNVGVGAPDDPQYKTAIQNYINKLFADEETDETVSVGASIARPQMDNITNPNRIILHIINQKNQDWVKAKAYYDEESEQIKIEVTYTKNGIAKILDEDGKILSENSKTADTGEKVLEKTEYSFTVIDKAGNKKKLKVTGIIPKFYGKEVTNYTEGGIKWKIFHKDDSNIYLIADDYIPYENLPKSTNGNALNKSSDYKAYFTNILNDYTGSDWILSNTNENAQKWLNKYLSAYPNSPNDNMKAVAYMMDTDSWNTFASSDSEYAIGGPTLEMFCASYKVTHPDKFIECDSITDAGYMVKFSNGSYNNSYGTYMSGLTKDDFEEIYIKSNRTKSSGMWLASPGAAGNHHLMSPENDGFLGAVAYSSAFLGFRPIVCLKSGIELQNNGDGTYKLDLPIEAKGYYDETAEKIKIEVTYTKNGIAQILDEKGSVLSENSLTAETSDDEVIGNGDYKFKIIDKEGNEKEITVSVSGLKVYIIKDEKTLKEFRDAVNAVKTEETKEYKAYQIADVEMNKGKYTIDNSGEVKFNSNAEQWEPIGNNSSKRYSGTYDGKGHTISGIYINGTNSQGLFKYAEGATIKNVGIKESYIKGSSNVGGIVGTVDSGIIENCYNAGTVEGSSCVGGICGYGDINTNISNCYNVGAVKGTYRVGGICGEYEGGTIKNNYNTGEITATGQGVGGIIGEINDKSTISHNYNIGKINATNSKIGGIIGYINSGTVQIEYCYNIGDIEGKGCVAGILGEGASSTTINYCYNKGNITSSDDMCGGILGYTASRIEYSYNTGNITGDSSFGVGGISGYYGKPVGCYNIGEITGEMYVGGINGNSTATNCYNMGIVSGNSSIGAINGTSTATNCYYEENGEISGMGNKKDTASTCIKTTRTDIISRIQALSAYKRDEYNINNGIPILSWQTDNDNLDLINGENAFVEDTNNINNGYPILAWQAK